MILSGSSHPELAISLSKLLKQPLADVDISKFPNGEKRVWVKTSLKKATVGIVQSFSDPVDEHIIEFCLLADAAKHLGAQKIIGIIPWLGYSPQDKLFRPGEPISIHVIARMLETVGVNHLVIADIHSTESLEHFSIPVTEVSAVSIFINYFQKRSLKNHVAVALDKGATPRATEFAQALNLPLVQFEKFRDRATGAITFKSQTGDMAGKHAVSFDDFVSTGSTRIVASEILKQQGALTYTDCITHALLAGDSVVKLKASSIDHLLTTDSYPIPPQKRFSKLEILPIAPLLAKAVIPLLQ